MKHIVTALLLSFFFITASAKELSIGIVRLSLGMDQEVVLNELRKSYNVKEQEGNYYFVSSGKEPNFKYLGHVTFSNRKLSSIQRDWGSFKLSNTSVEYASTLFAAIESATVVSGSSAKVSTRISRNPDFEVKQIDFVFTDRKITALTTESRDPRYGRQAGISETVSSN